MRCEWGDETHGRVYGWAEGPPPLPALGARRPRPHGRREGRGGRLAGPGAALSLGCWRPLGKGDGGGERGALYSVPQVAVTDGVPGGGTPLPACASVHVALGAVGSEPCLPLPQPLLGQLVMRAAQLSGKRSGGNFLRSPRGLSEVEGEEKDRADIAPHEITFSGHLRAVQGRGGRALFIDAPR